MLKTEGNSIFFGGCWTYKSGLKNVVSAPFFGTSKWAILAKVPPKNGTLGARTKIWRPLLQVQHSTKMMKLSLVLSVFHFWEGFEPIFKLVFSPCILHYEHKKIFKEHYFWKRYPQYIPSHPSCVKFIVLVCCELIGQIRAFWIFCPDFYSDI